MAPQLTDEDDIPFPRPEPDPDVPEFDEDELQRLIAEALGEFPSGRNAVAFGDTQILAALSQILPEYLDRADVAMIFDRVRGSLYEGLNYGDLRSLHTTVKHCRVCPNVVPDPQLPAWNRADPDVVFVGDTPWRGGNADQYLANLLQAVGFKSRRICYTSAVRCFPKDKRPPSADEVTNCTTRYLYNELQQMAPKLIVAVGAIATTALLGEPISVVETRGTIYWLGPWPVLVMTSPAYAMRTERAGTQFATDLNTAYAFTYGDTK